MKEGIIHVELIFNLVEKTTKEILREDVVHTCKVSPEPFARHHIVTFETRLKQMAEMHFLYHFIGREDFKRENSGNYIADKDWSIETTKCTYK